MDNLYYDSYIELMVNTNYSIYCFDYTTPIIFNQVMSTRYNHLNPAILAGLIFVGVHAYNLVSEFVCIYIPIWTLLLHVPLNQEIQVIIGHGVLFFAENQLNDVYRCSIIYRDFLHILFVQNMIMLVEL